MSIRRPIVLSERGDQHNALQPGDTLSGIPGSLIAVTVYSVVAQTITFNASTANISCSKGVPLVGSPVVFSTTGLLPANLSPDTTYFVILSEPDNSRFQIAATFGDANGDMPIAPISAGVGTHSIANPRWWKSTNNPSMVDFELQGAGASGGVGGPDLGTGSATGGSAGGYARLRRRASVLPASLNILIGAAGLPPSVVGYGNPGENTSLGNIALANGGRGGLGLSTNATILGSSGGTAQNGDLIIDGGASAPVLATNVQNFTAGGNSMFGFGGNAWAGAVSGNTPNLNATGRGAGGAGGISKAPYPAGRGSDGLVICREYS